MSRYISDGTKRIDLGEGEWVDLKEGLSYEVLLPIVSKIDPNDPSSNIAAALPLLTLAIIDWNMKNNKGEDIKFEKKKIGGLDMVTVTELVLECQNMYFPQKKNSDQ